MNNFIKEELQLLVKINPYSRKWYWCFFMAMAISFPIFVGAYTGHFSSGLLGSFGSLIILNMPHHGSLFFRMSQLLSCGFGLITCFGIGLIAHHIPWLTPVSVKNVVTHCLIITLLFSKVLPHQYLGLTSLHQQGHNS